MNKKAKKVFSFVAWIFIGVVVFSLILVYTPKLAKIIYPGVEEIAALEDCGISTDEFPLLEKLGVKADSWTECFLAQKALKEYYKNELNKFKSGNEFEEYKKRVGEIIGIGGGYVGGAR